MCLSEYARATSGALSPSKYLFSPWQLPPSLTSVPDQNGVLMGHYLPIFVQSGVWSPLAFLLGKEAPLVSLVAPRLPLARPEVGRAADGWGLFPRVRPCICLAAWIKMAR